MEFPFNAARSSGAAQRSAGQTVVALSSFNVWMCECDQGVPDEEIIALSEHEYLPEHKTESELDPDRNKRIGEPLLRHGYTFTGTQIHLLHSFFFSSTVPLYF